MSAIAAATAATVAAAPVQPAAEKPKAVPEQANAAEQTAAAAPAQTPAAPQPAPAQGTEPQDTVTISSTAQGALAQPTSSQVALLSAEGESVAEIAQQLGISQQAVQSYLG